MMWLFVAVLELRVACCWSWMILVFCCVVWITSRGEQEEPPHSSKQKEIPLQDCHVGFFVNLSSVAACWIQCRQKHAKATQYFVDECSCVNRLMMKDTCPGVLTDLTMASVSRKKRSSPNWIGLFRKIILPKPVRNGEEWGRERTESINRLDQFDSRA